MSNTRENAKLLVYDGNKPYVFISYSHADSKTVEPMIFAMQEKGYRVWFDAGIKSGVEWTDYIASKIRTCSAFVFIASKKSVRSERCRDELEHVKKHNKPALMAFIENNVSLPEGVELQTARFQRVSINDYNTMESFIDAICNTSFIRECRGDYTKEDIYGIIRRENQRVAEEKKRIRDAKIANLLSGLKKNLKWILAVIAIFFAATWITVIIPNQNYNKANLLLSNEEYADAFRLYQELGDHKDSREIAEKLLSEHEYLSYLDAKIGTTIVFGKYEQDNNWENGYDDIEWIVLENTDNKLLLVSKYALDCKPYHNDKKMVDWNGSYLRSWLNSNFFNGAFSEREKKAVALTNYVTVDNNDYGTPGGYDTQDYVFLLNLNQVRTHKSFLNASSRLCQASEYAKSLGAYVDAAGYSWWWLCTPGEYLTKAAGVSASGEIVSSGDPVNYRDNAVRPAIWLDLEG